MSFFGINVFDFGAKGDGITDDTAAIQSAIDYAAKRGGVRLPIRVCSRRACACGVCGTDMHILDRCCKMTKNMMRQ